MPLVAAAISLSESRRFMGDVAFRRLEPTSQKRDVGHPRMGIGPRAYFGPGGVTTKLTTFEVALSGS
jgi:hypothetical protein